MQGRTLTDFLPAGTDALIKGWLTRVDVELVLTKPRRSKLGDFRAGPKGSRDRISINIDLKPFQFLITMAHEIAHAQVWQSNRRRQAPHGLRWKTAFGRLLLELSEITSLPKDFRQAIHNHAQAPTSCTGRDLKLMQALRSLETTNEVWLDEVSIDGVFQFRGQRFKKLTSNRTRCKCLHLGNHLQYTIAKTAAVLPK
jgi:SprT protein